MRVGAAWSLGSHKSRLCRGIGVSGLEGGHCWPSHEAWPTKAQSLVSIQPLCVPWHFRRGQGSPGTQQKRGQALTSLCVLGVEGVVAAVQPCVAQREYPTGVRGSGHWEVCRSLLG